MIQILSTATTGKRLKREQNAWPKESDVKEGNEMSQQQVTEDAERATRIILAGVESEIGSLLEAKVRQAYLLGRAHQAAENFQNVLAHVRGRSLKADLTDSIEMVRRRKLGA